MSTTPPDVVNPAAKPHGTTADQIAEMESEGQAQGPPAPPVPLPGFNGEERRRPLPGIDAPSAKGSGSPSAIEDQDIDTAGVDR